ncbi:MAG: ATP-binding cassette domain-containing protein [Xanthomonadales bacterium]|nr:ATP-binding cassette domain-containing protein [Xanthomonadales bacterium]
MLQLNQISLRRGTRLLFGNANLTVHPGQRLGLVGANGCGKTSLFAMLQNQLDPDEGEVYIPAKTVIAQVEQETPALSRCALDFVIDGDKELRALQAELEQAQETGKDEALPHIYEQIENIDGYRAEQRAARMLNGLGFRDDDIKRAVAEFSGGWRMRLNLAQALMRRSDLLLLDEPTNHLDLPAIVWLERWLQSYPGVLLAISHDRDFLDGISTHIAHIEHEQLTQYTGNYSNFEKLRAERLALQQAMHDRQQREIKHIESFITRFKAKASKAKQAQSRVKMLERMSLIAPAHADSPFGFQFLAPHKLPNHLFKLERCDVGYEQAQGAPLRIVNQVNLSISAGDRVALLGMNGAGKSTVMKAIAQGSTMLSGERLLAQDCNIAYFAQHQVEQLNVERSAFDHLRDQDDKLTEQEIRNFLGGFDFHGDRIFEPVGPFSGGEKARLVLALMIQQRPNLLLLDEPTNHLDLQMRQALSMALQSYDGALVIIAHDRHLIRSVCDELYIVHEGQCTPYKDDLDTYSAWLSAQNSADKSSDKDTTNKNHSKKANRKNEAEKRRLLKPYSDRIRKAEKAMEKLRKQLGTLEEQLGDSDLYSNEQRKDEMKNLLQQQAEHKQALDEVEMEWLEASEDYENKAAQY